MIFYEKYDFLWFFFYGFLKKKMFFMGFHILKNLMIFLFFF